MRTNYRDETSQLKEHLQNTGGWLTVLDVILGISKATGNFKSGQFQKGVAGSSNQSATDFCPVHGGDSGKKFHLLADGDTTGGARCWVCSKTWSDGFDLIMDSCGVGFVEAKKMVMEACDFQSAGIRTNYSQPKPKPKPQKPEFTQQDFDNEKKRKDKMNKIWSEAIPLDKKQAEPAIQYFVSRGIINVKNALRNEVKLHPNLPYFMPVDNENLDEVTSHPNFKSLMRDRSGNPTMANMGGWPTLVCMIRDKFGKPINIQRIYITQDGRKAPFENIKKLMPSSRIESSRGGAIQLSTIGSPCIGVAEGPETTLAIMSAINMPMVCCVTAGMLEQWEPSDGTKCVFIFEDDDASGRGTIAAKKLEEKLKANGLTVWRLSPPIKRKPNQKSVDWQDVVQVHNGNSGFPPFLRQWQEMIKQYI